MKLISSLIMASLFATAAYAGEFAVDTCTELAIKEGWDKPQELCECLGVKAAEDEALDRELVEVQSQKPEDRVLSETAQQAIEDCS